MVVLACGTKQSGVMSENGACFVFFFVMLSGRGRCSGGGGKALKNFERRYFL